MVHFPSFSIARFDYPRVSLVFSPSWWFSVRTSHVIFSGRSLPMSFQRGLKRPFNKRRKSVRVQASLVGGDWNMILIFPFSWECHHPKLTHIFQRGSSTTKQILTWLHCSKLVAICCELLDCNRSDGFCGSARVVCCWCIVCMYHVTCI